MVQTLTVSAVHNIQHHRSPQIWCLQFLPQKQTVKPLNAVLKQFSLDYLMNIICLFKNTFYKHHFHERIN